MQTIDLSVIIPAYNRTDLLKYTLESVKRAIKNLTIEIILVDDGSDVPLEDQLGDYKELPIVFIRQTNKGLVFAKNTGLTSAKGEFIQYLDSDDLVHEDKFVSQLAAMRESGADMSYCDTAFVRLEGNYNNLIIETSNHQTSSSNNPTACYLQIGLAPHSPIFRRSYLLQYLLKPLIAPNQIYNPIGEIWIYYNLAPYPATIIKVDGEFAIINKDFDGERITKRWEKMAIASAAMSYAFARYCQPAPANLHTRQLAWLAALDTLRRLPSNFSKTIDEVFIKALKRLSKPGNKALTGGKLFKSLSLLIGPVRTAILFRSLLRPSYTDPGNSSISRNELQELEKQLINYVKS